MNSPVSRETPCEIFCLVDDDDGGGGDDGDGGGGGGDDSVGPPA